MQNWLEKITSVDLIHKMFERISPVILFLLILYLCWKLASLFWLMIAPPQVYQSPSVTLGSQQAQVPNIANFALFHEAGNQPFGQDDQLNLTLQGVMVADSQHFSSAVIKVAERAERYRIGETLEGTSYQLAEVDWHGVVLRQQNGTTRSIEFQGMQNGLNQAMASPSLARHQAVPQTNKSEQHLGQASQRLQENREQYLQEMGLQATAEGYQVSANTPAILRNKLGLQPGDQILSLNGKNMSGGQTEAQLLEHARQQGQVRLEIKRGDQVMTIQQDFK